MRNRSEALAAALTAATRRLSGAGVADAQRDARVLLREALGVDGPGLAVALGSATHPGESENPDLALARFAELIERRAARVPVSHLLGRREFYGRSFRVDGRALDPRPDSETLVSAALRHLPFDAPARVLDLGVGSGCLLLSVLAERPLASGVGVDRSADALTLAAENAAHLSVDPPLGPRVTLVRGDWLDAAPPGPPFDLILCNPPYIASDDVDGLEPEVRLHEPLEALTPGPDALAAYRALAPKLAALLSEPEGAVLFEVGRGQAAAVRALLAKVGFRVSLLQDLNGVERVVCGELA
ncbi:MAG: peptide chain release factor N(5)-glutamine methyltransferase [Pseudomonadota bacterium]